MICVTILKAKTNMWIVDPPNIAMAMPPRLTQVTGFLRSRREKMIMVMMMMRRRKKLGEERR